MNENYAKTVQGLVDEILEPQTEKKHSGRGYTASPPIAVNGHIYCDCGIPEPVRVCTCDRPFRGPLELGSCRRCRFWLRHMNGDHRRIELINPNNASGDRVVWETPMEMLDDIWLARKQRDTWKAIADGMAGCLDSSTEASDLLARYGQAVVDAQQAQGMISDREGHL